MCVCVCVCVCVRERERERERTPEILSSSFTRHLFPRDTTLILPFHSGLVRFQSAALQPKEIRRNKYEKMGSYQS